MSIGFIGCGNMAQPIIRSIAKKGVANPSEVFVYDLDREKLLAFCKETGVQAANAEKEITSRCSVVFLCIKPQGFPALLTSIAQDIDKNKPFVVSIAAGKDTHSIAAFFEEGIRVGRIFPNLNANVAAAASAYCGNNVCKKDDLAFLRQVCESFGSALEYPEELFAQFGVLGGCAPAYAFLFIDSLAKAGEKNGMEYSVALSTAIQVVLGSAKYMKESGISPETLIDRVCSKGGTTIEGVNYLRGNAFSDAVKGAFDASLHRDREMRGLC